MNSLTLIEENLTFDDVLLEPQYSEIDSRKDVDLSTQITPLRSLQIPIIAANMDTVCDGRMAIRMGELGGMGVIHRYMTHERQVEEVRKTSESLKKLKLLMPVAAAIGVRNGVLEHSTNLAKSGCSILVVDVAHGDHKLVHEVVKGIRRLNLVSSHDHIPVEVIAGNIATAIAAFNMRLLDVAAVKVGVGPGSLCSTRIVTGHGFPQLSAIFRAYTNHPFVIADGGIRNSGDIVKALAAGARAVMCGSLFAGTDETPGEVIGSGGYGGSGYKIYRGMASIEANRDFYGNNPDAPEGISTTVPCKGPVLNIVKNLVAGVCSGLSYSGAQNISELRRKANWIKMSSNALKESVPHLVYK